MSTTYFQMVQNTYMSVCMFLHILEKVSKGSIRNQAICKSDRYHNKSYN